MKLLWSHNIKSITFFSVGKIVTGESHISCARDVRNLLYSTNRYAIATYKSTKNRVE